MLPQNQTTLYYLQTNDEMHININNEMHININNRNTLFFTDAEYAFLTWYCCEIFHTFSPFVPHMYNKYNSDDKYHFSRKKWIAVKNWHSHSRAELETNIYL